MEVSEYIEQKFTAYGVTLPEAAFVDIAITCDVDKSEEVSKDNITRVERGIAQYIPQLLLSATSSSVSENGFSESHSWDISGIKDYYHYLCKKVGLKDELTTTNPKITFF